MRPCRPGNCLRQTIPPAGIVFSPSRFVWGYTIIIRVILCPNRFAIGRMNGWGRIFVRTSDECRQERPSWLFLREQRLDSSRDWRRTRVAEYDGMAVVADHLRWIDFCVRKPGQSQFTAAVSARLSPSSCQPLIDDPAGRGACYHSRRRSLAAESCRQSGSDVLRG